MNTIFCGANAEGSQTGWNDGAILADGRYMSIDQNQKVVEIPTPQDAAIARLGVDLNKTYLPYGKMGQAGQARQSAQDANAGDVVAERPGRADRSPRGMRSTATTRWDLVDAIKNGKCKLEDVKDGRPSGPTCGSSTRRAARRRWKRPAKSARRSRRRSSS